MIKLGMIGMNEGNGHPYSYSAMFNGYDPLALKKKCPFPLIKEYLPALHKNKNMIDGAIVSHIWTQDRSLSQDIASVSKIPNIVGNIEDLLGEVDGVILARDDPWNHLAMAKPFLKEGIPIFIDKQLVSSERDLSELIKITGKNYPLMAGSSIRYTKELNSFLQDTMLKKNTMSIHGMSRVNWMRYGHHLLEGIVILFGHDILNVRSLSSKDGHDIVQISYKDNLNVILEFIEDIALPIQFTCFTSNSEPVSIPFIAYYSSFRKMMNDFKVMIETNIPPIPFNEIVSISKIVIAGDLSKKSGGIPYNPKNLRPHHE